MDFFYALLSYLYQAEKLGAFLSHPLFPHPSSAGFWPSRNAIREQGFYSNTYAKMAEQLFYYIVIASTRFFKFFPGLLLHFRPPYKTYCLLGSSFSLFSILLFLFLLFYYYFIFIQLQLRLCPMHIRC